MKILPDRDKLRKWYLDEDVAHVMHNRDLLIIGKGFRFDGHSTKPLHWLFKQYKLAMQLPEYKVTKARAFWMPLAVQTYNAIKYYWRDYRGEVPKEMTVRVSVKVSMVK